MLCFPNAKINLGLNVVGKRPDGFHNIETCFFPVGWCDILEIIKAPTTDFSFSGLTIAGDLEHNLCYRAYHLLQSDFQLSPIQLHLHKIIPLGGGLGGGSSDAAATLNLLNQVFALGLDKDRLKKYAQKLGTDCSFFIDNQPALATGKGDQLETVNLDLSGTYLILANPNIHINTAEAYNLVEPKAPLVPLEKIIRQSPEIWKEQLTNDFEAPVFESYPEIATLKQTFYELGAYYASMSGSGASVYGLFHHEINDLSHLFPSRYSCWQSVL